MRTTTIFTLIFLGVFAYASHARAADFSSNDDFESYPPSSSIDAGNGGTGWGDVWSATAAVTDSSTSHTGTQSILLQSSMGFSGDIERVMSAATTGTQTIWVEADNLPTGTKGFIPALFYATSSLEFRIDWGSGEGGYQDNSITFGNNSGDTEPLAIGTAVAGTWYPITVELDQLDGEMRASFNGGAYTSWVIGTGGSFDTISKFRATTADGNSTDQGYHIDDIESGSSPPPPPTGDFNQVIQYIPVRDFATTTGTSTVGVEFSIPEPTWINYVGYRLVDPSGNIVYNASSSPPFITDDFIMQTDYNFTQSGLYTGVAYFNQNVGGDASNTWTVDNPTIQQVAVNLTNWTLNPDGSFTQNPATTSTTTLPNLSLDCGGGFAGSICNAVAKLIIPSNNSISLVQGGFSAILSKAPFSFMAETKNMIAAFNPSNAAAGGYLALTVFGDTIPIISTTTANMIGLNSTVLDAMKLLESAGIWLMLAWFIYWRVAETFKLST